MYKKFKIILPLYSNASRSAMSIGAFSLKGFSPELRPESNDFTDSNNSDVTFTARIAKVMATTYTCRPLTVIFSLKATQCVPVRAGDLVIGSLG